MSKQTLRIGAIGYGLRGTLMQAAHLPEEGVVVTALADVDEQAFERFREAFGRDALCVTDYRKLIERDDIDAVFILSPDHLHEEHAIESLKAGKAVYLENPWRSRSRVATAF